MTVGTASATLSRRLADRFHALRFADFPRSVVEKATDHVAYQLILALKGSRTEDGAQALRLARTLSDRGGPATIVGSSARAQPIDAAFANASMMRALECDDVIFPVGVHAGLVVQPPALAIAERDARSGADLLTAVIAGYAAIGTLGNGTFAWDAPQPRRPTIPFGPFGGAVACGLLLRLDPEQLSHAIGYAAQSAMGLAVGAVWTHYYSLVARNGMLSALLAQAGGRVSEDVLEGRYGFFETFFGSVPPGMESWEPDGALGAEILGTTTKRYPGTGINIVPIELMRELVRTERLAPDQVARIDITLPKERENFAMGHSLGPYERWRACSSLPFQLAMLIVDGGDTDFARYDQPDNAELLGLVSRMRVGFVDGRVERYAKLELTTTDGRRHVREGEDFAFPRLDARAELVAAGRDLVPESKLLRAAELLERLPSLGEVGELMECFIP